jgi:archaemetzincin
MSILSFQRVVFACGFLTMALISCKNQDEQVPKAGSKIKTTLPSSTSSNKTKSGVLIQPYSDLAPGKAQYIYQEVRKIIQNTKLLPPIKLPPQAYYQPRNRYKADTLLKYLKLNISKGQIITGITSKDISTKKGANPDSGIFGLGFMNGSASVVSNFRLHSNEQLFKTVIHELGHNFGLEHCPEKTCYMRDADGKNTSNEEKGFCSSCKNKLISAGWLLK